MNFGSPKFVRYAAFGAVHGAVEDVAYEATGDGTYWVLYGAVMFPVERNAGNAMHLDLRRYSPHPNLNRFLNEVRQARGDGA